MESMYTNSSHFNEKKPSKLSYWIAGLALIAGFILSVLSWVEICVEHCSANQEYRLFQMPFAIVGMAFFTVLAILHFFSYERPFLSQLVGWGLASALGAELLFIGIQKYEIGQWCPVCLSIALVLIIAALAYGVDYFKTLSSKMRTNDRGEIMKTIKRGLLPIPFFILGFALAFLGASKVDAADARAQEMKSRLAFGQKNSPVEVYIVTDWFCPSCKKLEGELETLIPKLESRSTYYFIDYPIHSKSNNFSPYNLSFLINDKPNYFAARKALLELTEQNDSPKDADIEKVAQKAHVKFKELTYLDVKSGMDFFDSIVQKYDLNATPTIIITNPKTNKAVKLEGRDEISEEKILKAIQMLNK
jgi:thiol-disulfide isomerase/thioredoxin